MSVVFEAQAAMRSAVLAVFPVPEGQPVRVLGCRGAGLHRGQTEWLPFEAALRWGRMVSSPDGQASPPMDMEPTSARLMLSGDRELPCAEGRLATTIALPAPGALSIPARLRRSR